MTLYLILNKNTEQTRCSLMNVMCCICSPLKEVISAEVSMTKAEIKLNSFHNSSLSHTPLHVINTISKAYKNTCCSLFFKCHSAGSSHFWIDTEKCIMGKRPVKTQAKVNVKFFIILLNVNIETVRSLSFVSCEVTWEKKKETALRLIYI